MRVLKPDWLGQGNEGILIKVLNNPGAAKVGTGDGQDMLFSNTFLTNGEGDYPEWLELYIVDSASVELAGFGLSDQRSKR